VQRRTFLQWAAGFCGAPWVLMAPSERQRDRARKRAARARASDLVLPRVKSPRRRAAAERDVYRFLRTYFEEVFCDPFTDCRREMVEAILGAARLGGDQAIAAPRGEGKTSIAECVVIYCLLCGILRFPLVCAATGPDAERILGNIKLQLETNDKLSDDYPEVCAPIRALEGAPQRAGSQTVAGRRTHLHWGGRYVVLPAVEGSRAAGAVLMTRGLDAAVRGLRYGQKRPDLVVIDDPETRESVESQVQTEARELKIEQDLAGLGGPGRRLARVMLTTIMTRRSLSWRYTDRQAKPSWQGRRYRLLLEKPAREDLWEEYQQRRQAEQAAGDPTARKAHRWYQRQRRKMDRGAKLLNRRRFIGEKLADGSRQEISALEHCYNIISDRGPEHFATEYQNDPPDPDEGLDSGGGLTAHRVQNQLSGYPRGIIPPDSKHLTAAIDVGKRALHWVVDAWRADATGFRLDYGVEEVWASDESDDRAVDRAILRALREWREATLAAGYRTADGQEQPLELVLVDAGWRTEVVYHFAREAGKLFRPVMGFGQLGDSGRRSYRAPAKPGKTKLGAGEGWYLSRQAGGTWLVCADSDRWKRWTWDRLLTPADRPGSFSLFGDDPRRHFAHAKHLTNEEEVQEFVRGKGLRRVFRAKSHTTHWLDAGYYSAVAASMLGVRLLGDAPRKRRRVRLSELRERKRRG